MKGKRAHAASSSSSDQDVPRPKRSARRAAPPTTLEGVQGDIEQETNVHEMVGEVQHEKDDHNEVIIIKTIILRKTETKTPT